MLRAAISNAGPGTIINFATNLSGQTITLTNGQLLVSSNLTIDASALASQVRISGNNASRVLMVTNNATVVLKSLTFKNGMVQTAFGVPTAFGGGIFNSTNCTLTLSNCLLDLNKAGDPRILSSVGGAGLYNAGNLTLVGCTVSHNTAATGPTGASSVRPRGGGLYNVGTATLTECTVSDNGAAGGDGLDNQDANSAEGGGIYNVGTLTLNRSTLSGNDAGGGFAGNFPASAPTDGGSGFGGGLYNAGSATLNQSSLYNNGSWGRNGGSGSTGQSIP